MYCISIFMVYSLFLTQELKIVTRRLFLDLINGIVKVIKIRKTGRREEEVSYSHVLVYENYFFPFVFLYFGSLILVQESDDKPFWQ